MSGSIAVDRDDVARRAEELAPLLPTELAECIDKIDSENWDSGQIDLLYERSLKVLASIAVSDYLAVREDGPDDDMERCLRTVRNQPGKIADGTYQWALATAVRARRGSSVLKIPHKDDLTTSRLLRPLIAVLTRAGSYAQNTLTDHFQQEVQGQTLGKIEWIDAWRSLVDLRNDVRGHLDNGVGLHVTEARTLATPLFYASLIELLDLPDAADWALAEVLPNDRFRATRAKTPRTFDQPSGFEADAERQYVICGLNRDPKSNKVARAVPYVHLRDAAPLPAEVQAPASVEQESELAAPAAAPPTARMRQAVPAGVVWDACVMGGEPKVLYGDGNRVELLNLDAAGASLTIGSYTADILALGTTDDESVLAVQVDDRLVLSEGPGWRQRWTTEFPVRPGHRLLGVSRSGRALIAVTASADDYEVFRIDSGGARFDAAVERGAVTSAALSESQVVIVGGGHVLRGNVPGARPFDEEQVLAVSAARPGLQEGQRSRHFGALVERDGARLVRWNGHAGIRECAVEAATSDLRILVNDDGPLGVVTRVGGSMLYREFTQLADVDLA